MIGRPPDHSIHLARSELADEANSERVAAEHPDEHLRRREFLLRTAAAAGGAGLATLLPTDVLVAEAARRQGLPKLPPPRDLPIDTFVVLMMENRSFDHYFGWHPDADAKNRGLKYPNLDGTQKFKPHRLTPDFQGCGFRDPDHSWDGGRHQYNRGRMDGFYTGNEEGTGSDEFALGYYLEDDIPFVPHAAAAYTLYDRYFCSIMASTFPNRHYQWSGQGGGLKTNEVPPQTDETTGFTWETIFDRALSRGVSAMYFASDLPFAALYGTRGISWTRPIAEYYERAATGTLPNICFVDPAFGEGGFVLGGGAGGLSGDEHPHGDIRVGQAFMSDVVHAFMESPQYRRGALFINYDEWGGFFDHVRPRFVPDDRARRKNLAEDWRMTGFRIPGFAVSPYARKGGVSHLTVTHESILKLISYRFGLGHLNKRHRHASNIGRSFDFKRRDFDPAPLPDPATIAATPCATQGERGAARPKPHDMTRLETSGLLERLGYGDRRASFETSFRSPETIKRALRDTTR